nr:MAG TPA: hypothetical protein [Caudoviricetes sp.]
MPSSNPTSLTITTPLAITTAAIREDLFRQEKHPPIYYL